MNGKETFNDKGESRFFITAIQFLLISIMLSSFASLLGSVLNRIFPEYRFTGFSILAFIFALSSLILRHYQRSQSRFSQNILLLVFTEIIFIVISVKVYALILDGTADFWKYIASWEKDFLNSFFDLGTLIRTFGILFVWILSWAFSIPLHKFEEERILIYQENLGRTFKDIQTARREIISLIFPLGLAMIGMMSIIQYFPNPTSTALVSSNRDLVTLLIYFCAAFFLLALNQYQIMKAYWLFNNYPLNQDMTNSWIAYTLLFVIVVILVIIILPTNFSIGFGPFLRILTNILMGIFSLLTYLYYIMFGLIAALLNLLFPGTPIDEQVQQEFEEFIPPTISEPTAVPWLDLLKSILFWVTFLGIIIFSLVYFLKNWTGFELFFEKIKPFRWLKEFFNWIKNQFSAFQGVLSETVQKGVKNLKLIRKDRKLKLPKLASIVRKLPPRQRIIMAYIDWIVWNNKNGRTRKISQTPLEFAKFCAQFNPQADTLIMDFTNHFIVARYTRQKIYPNQAQEAKLLLQKMKESFSQLQEGQVK